MIVSFSLENWMSFRSRVTFSMVASRERQHGDRVPKLGKYQTRVLPVAAIYGGNASGKTNFFKALSFAKALVVKGTQPDSLIPVEPFRLDAKGAGQPSRFGFELLIDEII
ncbi:MAG TPA: abortive phage resistance protein, partial [Gallionella sp.]|nr:abortive phage resistance protein [Gallionella sp.]